MKQVAAEIKSRLKRAAKILITGSESQYFEDEMIRFSMENLCPVADPDFQGRRLNVLLPSLSASKAFGGLTTQVDLPLQIFKRGLVDNGWKIRFICTARAPLPDDNIVNSYVRHHGIDPVSVTCHFESGSGVPVPVGYGDLFLGSLWHNLSWALPLMRFQHDKFGGGRRPYISMVQDYEAGFHPWSSAYMLACAAYDYDWPKRIIFNSVELANYYKSCGHDFNDSCTFEPVMNASLRMSLAAPSAPAKERRILVYGRPTDRRNCFFLARKSLEIWSERYGNAGAWKVVSVGEAYLPFALSQGVRVEVLGKLTLAQYAEQLHRAAVGLSLMASPHPSYPPLEMAHFGAITVCNNFKCKDMSDWHENLHPVAVTEPEHIAEGLIAACNSFENDPNLGLAAQTRKPHYLEEFNPVVLDRIAEMISQDFDC